MDTADRHGLLSEKEKQTLRLIVRGHDAKSIARSLDLSVHTVNDRLRDARRKLAVSSSREAARRLFEQETPDSMVPRQIGEAATAADAPGTAAPEDGGGRKRLVWTISGVAIMSFILALAAITSPPSPRCRRGRARPPTTVRPPPRGPRRSKPPRARSWLWSTRANGTTAMY